jgi:hypothetical protein
MNGPTHTINLSGVKPGDTRTDADGSTVSRSECGHIYTIGGPNGGYTLDMRDWVMEPTKKNPKFRNHRPHV